MREIISGVYTWSWLSPKHGYDFNGYAFQSEDGLIFYAIHCQTKDN